MTHEELVRSLDSYLDGTISDEARRSVETHLASCASCRDDLQKMGRLLDHAAVLRDRPATPSRDLWPHIRSRLDPAPARRSGRRPVLKLRFAWTPGLRWAMAAVVLLAVIWVVGNLLPGPGPDDLADGGAGKPSGSGSVHEAAAVPGSGSMPVGSADLTAELNALDAEYAASRRLVVQAAEAALDADRDPGWAVFKQSLDVLDEAISESRRALEEHPESVGLQRVLLITYQKQLDLLRWAQRVIGRT